MFVKYDYKMYEDIEIWSFVDAVIKAGKQIKENEVFKSARDDKKNKKEYTPDLFMDATEYYCNKKDFILGSCTLWLAASYTLKEYFLKLKVHVGSHTALDELVKLVLTTTNGETHKNIRIGWKAAQDIHRYSYGDAKIERDDLDKKALLITKFCTSLSRVQRSVIQTSLDNLNKTPLQDGRLKLTKKKQSLRFCQKHYDYEYNAEIHKNANKNEKT